MECIFERQRDLIQIHWIVEMLQNQTSVRRAKPPQFGEFSGGFFFKES